MDTGGGLAPSCCKKTKSWHRQGQGKKLVKLRAPNARHWIPSRDRGKTTRAVASTTTRVLPTHNVFEGLRVRVEQRIDQPEGGLVVRQPCVVEETYYASDRWRGGRSPTHFVRNPTNDSPKLQAVRRDIRKTRPSVVVHGRENVRVVFKRGDLLRLVRWDSIHVAKATSTEGCPVHVVLLRRAHRRHVGTARWPPWNKD